MTAHHVPQDGEDLLVIKMVSFELMVCDGNSFLIAIYKQIQVSHVNTWHKGYCRSSSRVFFKKHKLYYLIKREIHILITITIKKTYKYIKFTIAFYEFSYFEIGA